jgi:dipeptidyl aminopeptidase/acylaminoacyl peptidase
MHRAMEGLAGGVKVSGDLGDISGNGRRPAGDTPRFSRRHPRGSLETCGDFRRLHELSARVQSEPQRAVLHSLAMRLRPVSLLLLVLSASVLAQTSGKRAIKLDDLDRLHEVRDPQCSPDGAWVAYSFSVIDPEADKRVSHISMVSFDKGEALQLTYGNDSDSNPRWSPDGRYLAFTSSRTAKPKGSQIWVLDRRGGEGRQLTHLKNYSIDRFEWSPDSKKLLLVMSEKEDDEPKPAAAGADASASAAPAKKPKPVIIDRYHFKQDVQGYLSGERHSHIYVYDIASEKLEPITSGKFEERDAAWSPDGSRIAFVSNRDDDPDRSENSDVYVIDAKPGAKMKKLTTWSGPDRGSLSWSPDGRYIAYLQGAEGKYTAYNMNRLAVVPSDGGDARVVTAKFDRGVASPKFSADGQSIMVLVADDRHEYPASVDVKSGEVHRLVQGPVVVSTVCTARGHTAALASNDASPNEIYAVEDGKLRKLTAENDALMAELKLAPTEDVEFKSSDGTDVHGLLTRPLDAKDGKKYPLLLRIHGGPNGQDAHAFNFERQFFAANGYAVLNINYRGSAGRGEAFSRSIFADWGDHEVQDLLAGVAHVVDTGVADPDKLGIGGWSYGGILTDYTIASDGRFKAAIAGAASANQISMYGVDQYTYQYDNELGPPWKNPEGWQKVSYAFFKADKIHTPTLFMGGDKDFNVPLIGNEQMYQALRSLNVPTQLIVYPGEFHGFTRPSFIRDRYERYLAWYDKYLKGTQPKAAQPATTKTE